MIQFGKAEDPRRRLLIQALAAGFFSGSLASREAMAQIFGTTPAKLPQGRSIYRISGQVLVDGKPATLDTKVGSSSTLETAKNSEVIYAVGESAFILRSESRVTLEAREQNSLLLAGLRLLTGKILSVFPSRGAIRMTTKNATIGIRGTGVYMESDPEQTYFCTCYGMAEIASADDPENSEVVTSLHHDRPLYVVSGAQPGKGIRDAPFINHTDQELMLVETLVGRKPPFIFPKDDYSGPRRSY